MSKASKNQRSPKKKPGEFQASETNRIIPLNKGRHAYVLVQSKSLHVPVLSDAWDEAIDQLDPEQVRAELSKLDEKFPANAWDVALALFEQRQQPADEDEAELAEAA